MALKEANLEPLDLDVDLTQVDTSMPVLPPKLYDLRIHDINRVENKEKNGFNLEVTFATREELETQQNGKVAKDFPLKSWYPLQAKADAADPEFWKKNLAGLIDAALGTEQGNRPKFSKQLLLNKVVRALIKVDKDENGRPRNSIGYLTYPKE